RVGQRVKSDKRLLLPELQLRRRVHEEIRDDPVAIDIGACPTVLANQRETRVESIRKLKPCGVNICDRIGTAGLNNTGANKKYQSHNGRCASTKHKPRVHCCKSPSSGFHAVGAVLSALPLFSSAVAAGLARRGRRRSLLALRR